jgi:glutathione S-transferase
MQEPDPENIAAAVPEAREGLAAYERFAADDGTVCGGGFTIADCAVLPNLLRALRPPLDFEADFPKLARIRAAALERPSVAAAGLLL